MIYRDVHHSIKVKKIYDGGKGLSCVDIQKNCKCEYLEVRMCLRHQRKEGEELDIRPEI